MTTNNDKKEWSQIRETVLMINVATVRIEHAMMEGNESFTSLSQSFVETVNSAQDITQLSEELEDSVIKTKIIENCQNISQRVGNSIIAFQFYDKLCQRMALISKTLDSLTGMLEDGSKMHKPEEWQELQNTIRSKYTLDSDQEMFNAVLNGIPIAEALKIALTKTNDNEIELF